LHEAPGVSQKTLSKWVLARFTHVGIHGGGGHQPIRAVFFGTFLFTFCNGEHLGGRTSAIKCYRKPPLVSTSANREHKIAGSDCQTTKEIRNTNNREQEPRSLVFRNTSLGKVRNANRRKRAPPGVRAALTNNTEVYENKHTAWNT